MFNNWVFSPENKTVTSPELYFASFHGISTTTVTNKYQASNMKSLNTELGEVGPVSSNELAAAHYRIIMANKMRSRPVKLEIW